MSASIDFIFDFASPNAYLVHKVLPEITARNNATINYQICLLGGIFKSTGNQAPMLAFANIPAKLEYEQLEMQRFIEKHQLDKFTFNPHFPVNSLLLMRGAIEIQRDSGDFEKYIETGLRCMWEDGLKMDDPDVYVKAMTNAGFDGANLLEKTADPAVKQQLMNNTSDAVARGVFGVPTFFVGDEMFFGKERLDQVEAALQKGG
ncbi:MAG: 2-hydroxychromene-2-carboxylate isomerase [Pseudomonadales bacterium]|nr:2-hydroxychromene-2-carboxylate isomerase [Pseudomonadales bacterium]